MLKQASHMANGLPYMWVLTPMQYSMEPPSNEKLGMMPMSSCSANISSCKEYAGGHAEHRELNFQEGLSSTSSGVTGSCRPSLLRP